MKQHDETNVTVLRQLQEYAQLYFEAIIDLNPDLKPGKYSAKEMSDNSHRSIFGHYYPLPNYDIFDENIEISIGSFNCKFPYRQIFYILAQWEAMMGAGKLKAVFEIGNIEEKTAKVLLNETTNMGAYKEKRVKLQRITGNWWKPRKIKDNIPTPLYYELNGVVFAPGKQVFSEDQARSEQTTKWCEQYDDATITRLILAQISAGRGVDYWSELARRANITPQPTETPQISTEAPQVENCAAEGEKREETADIEAMLAHRYLEAHKYYKQTFYKHGEYYYAFAYEASMLRDYFSHNKYIPIESVEKNQSGIRYLKFHYSAWDSVKQWLRKMLDRESEYLRGTLIGAWDSEEIGYWRKRHAANNAPQPPQTSEPTNVSAGPEKRARTHGKWQNSVIKDCLTTEQTTATSFSRGHEIGCRLVATSKRQTLRQASDKHCDKQLAALLVEPPEFAPLAGRDEFQKIV